MRRLGAAGFEATGCGSSAELGDGKEAWSADGPELFAASTVARRIAGHEVPEVRVKGFCEAVQVRRVSLTPPPSIRWYRLYPMPLQRRPSPGSGRPGASWHRWRVDRGDGLGEAAIRGSAYVNRLELVDHQAAPACGNGQDLMARSAAACPPTSRTDGKRHDFLALKSIDAHPPA